MNRGSLKTLLAAVGAVVIIVIALSLVVSLLTGRAVSRGGSIAVIKLEGVITDPLEITTGLKELRERDDIKAVVIRINSPGGAVGPSQEINSEIKRLAKAKKVVASMGAIAASGGYYAAIAANKIVANPGTITGSIGVIIEFVNASELLSKIGLKGYVIKSGKFKDTGSPLRKMEDDESAYMQDVVNNVNRQFIKAVAEGRKLKEDDVAKIADGRVFTGLQAKELGLIDSIGDLTDAIDLAANLAGIKGKPNVVYIDRKGAGIWRAVFGNSAAESFADLFSGMRVMYMVPQPLKQ